MRVCDPDPLPSPLSPPPPSPSSCPLPCLRTEQPAQSGALSGLISAGLGRFGLGGFGGGPQRPQAPWQCSAVLVFVVGGLSMAEVRQVKQEVEEAAAVAAGGEAGLLPVLVGGTALVSPLDVAQQLLVARSR